MERIIIQEIDNTSNVEALSSYDVVYVPGFSAEPPEPIMVEDESGDSVESLYRTPRLITSKYEFRRLYGQNCPTFATDQLYPVASQTSVGFPAYAIPGFIPPGEPVIVDGISTISYDPTTVTTDEAKVAAVEGELNYYAKVVFSEEEDTPTAPSSWTPEDTVTYYEAVFGTNSDGSGLITMKSLTADSEGKYTGKFIFTSDVSPVELQWRIYYNGEYMATDDSEIGFNTIGATSGNVKNYYTYEESPTVMFHGPGTDTAGDPDPGYRYALYLLSLGIPVYYECMNSTMVEVDMNDPANLEKNPYAESWKVNIGTEESPVYIRVDDTTVDTGKTYYMGSEMSVQSMYEGLENRFFYNSDEEHADYSFDSMGDYAIKYVTSGGYPTFEYGTLDTEGFGTSGLAENMIRLARRRADVLALIDHTDNPNRSIYATDTYSVINRIRSEFSSIDSVSGSFGAMFTPWYKCTHTAVTGGSNDNYESQGFMPASLAYLSALSQQLVNYNPWLAVSGVHRGVVPYFGKLHTNYALTNNVADSYQIVPGDSVDSTSSISINPITYIRNYGYCIWGNRTLRNNTDGTKSSSFLNIRNLVSDIKKALFNACVNLMFEQNTDLLWIDFKSIVTPLLESMVSNYIIGSYNFTRYLVDPETGAEVPSYKVLANLRITPINSVEVFDLTVTLENSELTVTETA